MKIMVILVLGLLSSQTFAVSLVELRSPLKFKFSKDLILKKASSDGDTLSTGFRVSESLASQDLNTELKLDIKPGGLVILKGLNTCNLEFESDAANTTSTIRSGDKGGLDWTLRHTGHNAKEKEESKSRKFVRSNFEDTFELENDRGQIMSLTCNGVCHDKRADDRDLASQASKCDKALPPATLFVLQSLGVKQLGTPAAASQDGGFSPGRDVPADDATQSSAADGDKKETAQDAKATPSSAPKAEKSKAKVAAPSTARPARKIGLPVLDSATK